MVDRAIVARESLCPEPGFAWAAPAERAEDQREREQRQRAGDSTLTEAVSAKIDEPESEGEHEHGPRGDEHRARAGDAKKERHLAGTVASPRCAVRDAGDDDPGDEDQRADQVQEERRVVPRPSSGAD